MSGASKALASWAIGRRQGGVGYEPQDDSEVVYADEIRRYLLDPARQSMVQGDARGGTGSR